MRSIRTSCRQWPRQADDFSGAQLHYSVDTVRYFRHTYHGQGDRIYFIIGADAFLDIPMWKEYEALLGLCDFIVANRPGIRIEALRLVIPPDLMATRGSTKRYRSGARIERGGASPPYFGLPARQRFQRSFRDRHPPPVPSRSRLFMDLSPHASRNTFSNRTYTVEHKHVCQKAYASQSRPRKNKKASGITVIDLREVGAFTSYFVICTGFSTPQVQAICSEIEEQLYKHAKRSPGAPRRARLGGMGAAGLWGICSSRIRRTGAALLRPGTAVAFGAETGNSRRAGRSVGQSHSPINAAAGGTPPHGEAVSK